VDTAAIRHFIARELISEDDTKSIEDDTPLCDGIIDSIGLIDLVGFLERDFAVHIDDDDLTSENFRTVRDIARLLEARATTG